MNGPLYVDTGAAYRIQSGIAPVPTPPMWVDLIDDHGRPVEYATPGDAYLRLREVLAARPDLYAPNGNRRLRVVGVTR